MVHPYHNHVVVGVAHLIAALCASGGERVLHLLDQLGSA